MARASADSASARSRRRRRSSRSMADPRLPFAMNCSRTRGDPRNVAPSAHQSTCRTGNVSMGESRCSIVAARRGRARNCRSAKSRLCWVTPSRPPSTGHSRDGTTKHRGLSASANGRVSSRLTQENDKQVLGRRSVPQMRIVGHDRNRFGAESGCSRRPKRCPVIVPAAVQNRDSIANGQPRSSTKEVVERLDCPGKRSWATDLMDHLANRLTRRS
jgi:hypothetical protein